MSLLCHVSGSVKIKLSHLFSDKQYDDEEETKRKEIFRSNVKLIELHNYLHDKGVKSFRLGVNEYADMVSKCESTEELTKSGWFW